MWMGPSREFLVMGIPSHRSSTTYLTINVENANACLSPEQVGLPPDEK